jgi:hypothetical protein
MSDATPSIMRIAMAADVPALFDVRTSVREHHLDLAGLAERGVTPASLSGMLADPESRTWVVEEARGVVAFCMADARRGAVFALTESWPVAAGDA